MDKHHSDLDNEDENAILAKIELPLPHASRKRKAAELDFDDDDFDAQLADLIIPKVEVSVTNAVSKQNVAFKPNDTVYSTSASPGWSKFQFRTPVLWKPNAATKPIDVVHSASPVERFFLPSTSVKEQSEPHQAVTTPNCSTAIRNPLKNNCSSMRPGVNDDDMLQTLRTSASPGWVKYQLKTPVLWKPDAATKPIGVVHSASSAERFSMPSTSVKEQSEPHQAVTTPSHSIAMRNPLKNSCSSMRPVVNSGINHDDLLQALRRTFKFNAFRGQQEEIIRRAIEDKDCFILLPTGGGKSLCYLLPAILQSGVTVVVSPLLALIDDQIRKCTSYGIEAVRFDADLKKTNRIFMNLESSRPSIKILFITPERLTSGSRLKLTLDNLHKRKLVRRFVYDEAHCISEWGHDFRPCYKKLRWVRDSFKSVPIMALTATATPTVYSDVLRILNIPNADVFKSSVNRSNLVYKLREKKKTYVADIVSIVCNEFSNLCGIVYCSSRNGCEDMAKALNRGGISAAPYHAHLDDITRKRNQENWLTNRIKVMVATIAFGMGVDKQDVRFVIHSTMPMSIGNYYQESGRAGRDGKRADCILLYDVQDLPQLMMKATEIPASPLQRYNFTFENVRSHDSRKELLGMAEFCENVWDCRRKLLMLHFNENETITCNGLYSCDNCCNLNKSLNQDGTAAAKLLVSEFKLVDLKEKVTLPLLIDILKGSRKKRITQDNLDKSKLHGFLCKWSRGTVRKLLTMLVVKKVLDFSSKHNAMGYASFYLKLGSGAGIVQEQGFLFEFRVDDTSANILDEDDVELE